jgi:DNA/RNA endonuclease G (NUC1)
MPNWVAERLTYESVTGKIAKRRDRFKTDVSVPETFRAEHEDYVRSGWSRGHLAALMNHKTSQETADETFLYSDNIVPQDMSMNGCDWLRLEDFAQSLVAAPGHTAYILTGPIWIPDTKNGLHATIAFIGVRRIPVPSHLFKVVKLTDSMGIGYTAGFIIPNRPINESRPLTHYQASIEYIEGASGLDLTGLKSLFDLCYKVDCQRTKESKLVRAWRHYARIQMVSDIHFLSVLVSEALEENYFRSINPQLAILVRSKLNDSSLQLLFADVNDPRISQLTLALNQ